MQVGLGPHFVIVVNQELSRCWWPSISLLRSKASFDDINAISPHPRPNVASVDVSGAGVGVGDDGLGDDMSPAEALRPPSRAQGVHSHQNIQSCHERNFHRQALSTRYEMCLFESSCLACARPLTRTISQSSSSSNSTPHSNELNRTPSSSVALIRPPEGSDKGEPMPLSDLPAPSDAPMSLRCRTWSMIWSRCSMTNIIP